MVIFYDKSMRLWTFYNTDKEGNQIGNAGYGISKDDAEYDYYYQLAT